MLESYAYFKGDYSIHIFQVFTVKFISATIHFVTLAL